ncbi:SIR2 family protein [Dolosigranulum pigrum]
MDIKEFISKFKNHPVLFIGTGLSMRYLNNSYSWEELLKRITIDLKGNDEFYYDLKDKYTSNSNCEFDKIASDLQEEFNKYLKNDRHGKFKEINDQFYDIMKQNKSTDRFKLYISSLLKELDYRETDEIKELKKARKNIGSIITTNYDTLLEDIFGFDPLIGNDILLSNPYGSLYKIHGCVTEPNEIIITNQDYNEFDSRYELIRAQLLSIFIHNPIIFLGYSIQDKNIKKILKTIFSYVDSNSEEAEKIREHFLLIEHEKGSSNTQVVDHDIIFENLPLIKINKLKTDRFKQVYKELSDLQIPVSVMDIRKVQNVVKDIYEGGEIQVEIVEEIDNLENSDKVLAIGSVDTIKYSIQNTNQVLKKYFSIIEGNNDRILEVVDQLSIQGDQYFPIYGFGTKNRKIKKINKLKQQQKKKIEGIMSLKNIKKISKKQKQPNLTIDKILENDSIGSSYKEKVITYLLLEDSITLQDARDYLINIIEEYEKLDTNHRMLMCAYDYKKYKNI